MKKIFLIISFAILSTIQLSAQATVDIPFTVSDGYFTANDLLRIGLDSTATDGIDPQLGEMELPAPAPGSFFPRFNLFWYTGSMINTFQDYRNAPSFPFTGVKEHTLDWSLSLWGTEFTLFYNFPPGVSAYLEGFNENLTDSGSFTFPTYCYSAILTVYYNNVGGDPTPGPVFCLIPDYLDFGEVAFSQTKTLPIMITNMGYLDSLYIYNAVSSNPVFTIEPNSYPVIIAPLQSQTFNITYTGTFGGEYIDSILFYHNASGSPSRLNVHAETISPNPNCFAQVLSEIIVTDSSYLGLRILNFGLDSSGTDGIDPQLGEMALPPLPPIGAFEARFFNFSGTLSSYCDFRYAVLPFTGQKEWTLAYQTGYGNTITIIWDFPTYITGVLQDFINGTFINVSMVDSGSFTVTNPFIFNGLRMLIDFNITSPVELISFSSDVFENVIKLNWTTATETNNSGFEILRFTQNENEWEMIGFVPGFGTTAEPKSYSFLDENVTTGIYKYRLKQIDFDGSFTYSNEIEVEVDFTPREFVLYQNYPNPFNPNTTIKFEIPDVETTRRVVFTTLKVYDILGNKVATLVNEEKQPGTYEVDFHPESGSGNPASGIYFYQLKAGSFIQTKKMILTK